MKTINLLCLAIPVALVLCNCGDKNEPVVPASVPELTSKGIRDVTLTTAAAGGLVISEGNDPVTEKGVCWSTSKAPTTASNKSVDGTGLGEFISELSGLSPNTVYYVRAYATNSVGTSYGQERSFKTYTAQVTDVDGNSYFTVTIGTQEWMAQNLKVTKYRDGDPIPHVTANDEWLNATVGSYCSYDNNELNTITYGRLYNGLAVDDPRNIAPAGWHVPSDAEWTMLSNYLVANGYGHEGSGDDIAKALASTTAWVSQITGFPSATAGMVGFDLLNNNSSGFSALPGGLRPAGGVSTGQFFGISGRAIWWSTTASRDLGYLDITLRNITQYRTEGEAIRCVKD